MGARRFAWTAVTFARQRYVWLALKDPRVLRSTILWLSNGGRHYPPWSGRHVSVMGLEEVTANFHYGLKESVAPNPLSKRGIATSVKLDPRRPLVVNYIMCVAEAPRGFDRASDVERDRGGVRLVAHSGKSVRRSARRRFPQRRRRVTETAGRFVVGVDVGGTHVTAAVVDVAGERIDRRVTRAPNVDSAAAAQLDPRRLGRRGSGSVRASNLPRVDGVGFAMPGPFDYGCAGSA